MLGGKSRRASANLANKDKDKEKKEKEEREKKEKEKKEKEEREKEEREKKEREKKDKEKEKEKKGAQAQDAGDRRSSTTPLDFTSSPLHLRAYTVKYQQELMAGIDHKRASTKAQEFCSSHFHDPAFLARFVADARFTEGPVVACGRVFACMALGYVVRGWATLGDKLGDDGVTRVREFEDRELGKLFPIETYCRRLGFQLHCSASAIVACMALLKRLNRTHAKPIVTSSTAHRLLLTAMVLALKSAHQRHRSNTHYARIGCVPLRALNLMEGKMAHMLGRSVQVPDREFDKTRQMLEGVIESGGGEDEEDKDRLWLRLADLVDRFMGSP